ncbi:MAG: acyl carrier protein [Bdellovibrionota bacterium]|jgi:acyl carrier protein
MSRLSRSEISQRIIDILVSDFDCERESLNEDSKLFEDLDLDSIDAVDLIVRLQKFMGRKVNPEEFKQIRTLGDLISVVEKIVNE